MSLISPAIFLTEPRQSLRMFLNKTLQAAVINQAVGIWVENYCHLSAWLICYRHAHFFFFFEGCTHCMWKFPSWGSNQSCSYQPMLQPQQCWVRITFQGKAGSLTYWAGPGIKPVSSWILVGFITAAPPQELLRHTKFYQLRVRPTNQLVYSLLPFSLKSAASWHGLLSQLLGQSFQTAIPRHIRRSKWVQKCRSYWYANTEGFTLKLTCLSCHLWLEAVTSVYSGIPPVP